MSDPVENRQIYYIPDNFINESRVHFGQLSVRVKYLIDSIALAAFFGIFAFLFIYFVMPEAALSAKMTVAVLFCGPGIILGQIGYNGDTLSTTVVNYRHWRKTNGIRLYNTNPRLLGTDPVRVIQEDARGKDVLVDIFAKIKDSHMKKLGQDSLVEGENFVFQYDPGIDNYTGENTDYAETFDPESVNISTDPDSELNVQYVFSTDGYNDVEDRVSINLSDFETN